MARNLTPLSVAVTDLVQDLTIVAAFATYAKPLFAIRVIVTMIISAVGVEK